MIFYFRDSLIPADLERFSSILSYFLGNQVRADLTKGNKNRRVASPAKRSALPHADQIPALLRIVISSERVAVRSGWVTSKYLMALSRRSTTGGSDCFF